LTVKLLNFRLWSVLALLPKLNKLDLWISHLEGIEDAPPLKMVTHLNLKGPLQAEQVQYLSNMSFGEMED
jgi:hypothetical protein